jgi:hypothetical protein
MSGLGSWETPGRVSLRLGLQRGLVEVVTTDEARTEVGVTSARGEPVGPEAVRVEARELPGGGTEVVVEQLRRRIVLGVGTPELRVAVRCPHGTYVEASTGSADVALAGRYGEVAVKTASGDCLLGRVEGSVRVGTASGDCRLEEAIGAASINTASGDVHVDVAHGPLVANLVSGDADVRDAHSRLAVSTVSGDVDVGACGDDDVALRTVSGDVRLGLRPGRELWFDVASVSGALRSELELRREPPPDGGAVAEVRVRTVSGDVTIGRAAVLAAS